MVYRSGAGPADACPRCREPLLPIANVSGVRWCEKCGGVMADVAATTRATTVLDRVLVEIGFKASLGKARVKDEGRRITCPECLIEMQRVRIESAACHVDACPSHGTWFDCGELEDVIRAFARARKGGLMPPAPYRAAAADAPYGKAETHGDEVVDARELFKSILGR